MDSLAIQRRLFVAVMLITAAWLLFAPSGCSPVQQLRGTALPPDLAEAAALLRKPGGEAEAVRKLDAVVQKRPKDVSIYIQIARGVCLASRKPDLAIRYAEQGLAIAPATAKNERIELNMILGEAYARAGDFTRSLEHHERAAAILPGNAVLMNNVAYAIAEAPGSTGRLNEALELARRAVEQARKDRNFTSRDLATFVDTLGWVQYRLGRLDEAIANLAEAADLAPDMAEIQYHLATAYEARGRWAEAATAVERGMRLTKDDPQLQSGLKDLKQRISGKLPAPRRAEQQ